MTAEQQMLTMAVREYTPFAAAEAWRDAADEFASGELEPLEEDKTKLEARLVRDEAAAAEVLAQQEGMIVELEAADAAVDAAELARVRVLRDGPMGQVATTKREGSSLFRARIEAKARISGMVAASKVGYIGPMPTAAEYADATVNAATEAMLEAGADPAVYGFTLRHVPQALSTLATAAGIDPAHINPFLAESGVGLTATGKKLDSPAKIRMRVPPGGGHVPLECLALEKEKQTRVEVDELRQLCIDFQESVPGGAGGGA